MEKIALDGFWLLGGLGVAYLVGVFTSQWLKDKINGVPSELRTALGASETAALNDLKAAKSDIVSKVIAKTKPAAAPAAAAAAPAPAPAPASVAAAPAAAPASPA
jgi:hypothetical protein